MPIKTLKLSSNMSRVGENWYIHILHLFSSALAMLTHPAACAYSRQPAPFILNINYTIAIPKTTSNRILRACILWATTAIAPVRMSNNAWTNSGAGPRQPTGSQSNTVASQGSAAPRFNAQEVRECLKNGIGHEHLLQWINTDTYKPSRMGTQRSHHIKLLEALRTVTRDRVVPGHQNVRELKAANERAETDFKQQIT